MDCIIVCDCKIARHEHGTRTMYVVHKCHGDACREAARVYESKRVRQRLYGIQADRVDAQPVRDHVQMLRESGLGTRRIAELVGVGRSTITNMIQGRRDRGHAPYARVARETAEKIFSVKPGMESLSPGSHVDATGTHRRIRALVSIGHSATSLGKRIGVTSSNMHSMMFRNKVLVRTDQVVREMYEELWDKPNIGEEWHGKAAASRARNYASARGWLPPMAWDDDLLDDPNYYPVVPESVGSKVDVKREAFIEEVEFFAEAGERISSVARALGITEEAVEKRLHRYGRKDLLMQIGYASKQGRDAA